ncbi:MAG: glycogen/starch synthase [Elusimicrobiota bacterium]
MIRAMLCLLLLGQPIQAAVLRAPVRINAGAGVAGSAGAAVGAPISPSGLTRQTMLNTAAALPSVDLPKTSVAPAIQAKVAAKQPEVKTEALPKAGGVETGSARTSAVRSAVRGDKKGEKGVLPEGAFADHSEELTRPRPGLLGAGLKAAADAEWMRLMGEAHKPLNILMAAGEAYPFVKTGGLADVVDDVSRGLAARGHHVTLVLPKYADISEEQFGMKRLPGAFGVPVGDHVETARLWRAEHEGVEVLFVENEEYFGRRGAYGHMGYDYVDNDSRYIFQSRATLEAVRFLERQVDVVHVHDWQVGLIPAYLKLIYNADPLFSAARSVMTIHNLAYQGFFHKDTLLRAGFSMKDYTFDKLEYYGNFSFLKAGLAFADALTTVSPTYAKEIQTEEFGHGMHGLLSNRKKDLVGVLNGIDLDANDPRTDKVLEEQYGSDTVASGKAKNKAALQQASGLAVDPGVPIFGVASRLAGQKGIDLIAESIDKIVKLGAQVYIIGSGESDLEDAIDRMVRRFPKNVHRHGFDTAFVKMVYAASDFLLMPSRFEPCGLSQQLAQRYGTLPIASRTGGLADTIIDVRDNPRRGDGFFIRDLTVAAIVETVKDAIAHFRNKKVLARSRRVAMLKNMSWESSLNRYVDLYRSLLSRE